MRNQSIRRVPLPLIENSRELFFSSSADLLAAMASPPRLHILSLVSHTEISVGALVEKIGLSQSATSQHLAKLRAARLVAARRDAQIVYYSLSSEAVVKILNMLKTVSDEDLSPTPIS
jgi:ArsR family transcriptional regulator, virulence genes transcriptional regulator